LLEKGTGILDVTCSVN